MALLVAAATTLATPVAFRYLIDIGFGSEAINRSNSNRNLIWLFLLATLLAASTAIRFYCVSWLGERITTDLRGDVYANVLQQDPLFFENLKTGGVFAASLFRSVRRVRNAQRTTHQQPRLRAIFQTAN